MSKILPRFSLFSMVLLTTIVALAVGLYSSARRNSHLQAINEQVKAENKQYRDELGIFEIEDPEKLHVLQIPTEGSTPRKYRVYLPPGRRYAARYKVNDIPEQGTTLGSFNGTIEPGTWVFSIKFDRSQDASGHPQSHGSFTLRREQQSDGNRVNVTGVGVSEHKNDWIVNKETGESAFGWTEPPRELQVLDPSEPLVLYRVRAHDIVVKTRDAEGELESWSTQHLPGEVDGFMWWIESEPLPTPSD
jgi:hypothetical protein